ncbi:MAG: hypothetical protein HRK26_01365, partial [Rickettsiaceae bacterium H1]|nr:hypothetical protein [Rickettsiaceae bacterium H1]
SFLCESQPDSRLNEVIINLENECLTTDNLAEEKNAYQKMLDSNSVDNQNIYTVSLGFHPDEIMLTDEEKFFIENFDCSFFCSSERDASFLCKSQPDSCLNGVVTSSIRENLEI